MFEIKQISEVFGQYVTEATQRGAF